MNDLEQENEVLENQQDAAEQYSKRNCLRISGIHEKPNVSIDDLVMSVCNTLKSDISLSEIDRCHRTGKQKMQESRDLIVKCSTYRARQKLYTKRTGRKDAKLGYRGTFVNEHLKLRRSKLLYAARSLAKEGNIVAAWSSDGDILVKYKVPGVSVCEENEVPTKVKRITSLQYLESHHG